MIIDLMFSLAIESRLFLIINDEKGKAYLSVSTGTESFLKLNNFEKYVFLLETYWSKYNFDEKFNRWSGVFELYELLELIANGKNDERILKSVKTYTLFTGSASFSHHLHYFGLCKLELIEGAKGKYEDSIKAVIPTDLGIIICKQLLNEAINFWNIQDLKILLEFGGIKVKKNNNQDLFSIIAGIFPDNIVQQTIIDEVEPEIDRCAVYTFKVSLSKNIWRKIRMSYKNTFEDLHLAIQEVFNFDNDHLYEFYIGGSRRTAKIIYTGNPYDGVEDDTYIGEAGIYTGQKIKYIFDFGDHWEFDIIVISIDKDVPIPVKPEIIESKGESPEQYPEWE
ncbi:MAG TPA: hypothetical protein DIV40_06925 [Clostridiales bacterium]|nr:hypothetical protein [Clostridiales bacterium]